MPSRPQPPTTSNVTLSDGVTPRITSSVENKMMTATAIIMAPNAVREDLLGRLGLLLIDNGSMEDFRRENTPFCWVSGHDPVIFFSTTLVVLVEVDVTATVIQQARNGGHTLNLRLLGSRNLLRIPEIEQAQGTSERDT